MDGATRKLVEDLQDRNCELEREVEDFQKSNGSLEKKLEVLQEQFDALLRRMYGRRSERHENPDQQLFFADLFKDDAPQQSEPPEQEPEPRRRCGRKRGPKPLPEHLPRDVVRLDPEEAQRTCACCLEAMQLVDEVVTEELTVEPPKFRVTQFVQGKWTCKSCMTKSVMKPLPARPIERGRPSPTLLAYIIVSKWCDHLPIYRQSEIFKRYGLDLSRKTIDGWLGKLASLLRPIVESIRRGLLERNFLQSDDTPLRYLDKGVKGKSPKGYFWSYGIPYGEVVYRFTSSHEQKHPLAFLEEFSGHLQTDGHASYNGVYNSGRVEHIGCMAHIRRKFEEAQNSRPARVEEILDLIGALYELERVAKENAVSGEALVELRRREALPILVELREKIDELKFLTSPDHKLGKAVGYAQGQWEAMLRYVDVAESRIDNNWSEQSMRPVVIGRKNFLFLGSEKGGGERAEVFYSLVESCRRLDIEPFAYLTDVIERISTHPQSRLGELTPRGWRDARASTEKLPVGTVG